MYFFLAQIFIFSCSPCLAEFLHGGKEPAAPAAVEQRSAGRAQLGTWDVPWRHPVSQVTLEQPAWGCARGSLQAFEK